MKAKSLSKLGCLIVAAEVLFSGATSVFASSKKVDEAKGVNWQAASNAGLTTEARLPKKLLGEAIVTIAFFAALKSLTATLATMFFSPSVKALAAIETKMGASTEHTGKPSTPNLNRT